MRPIVLVLVLAAPASASARELDRDTALRLLLEGASTPPDRSAFAELAYAPWKSGPTAGLWVVAGIDTSDDQAPTLWTAVLREKAGAFEKVAGRDRDDVLVDEAMWHCRVKLDLIPFRMSKADIAFGVRTSSSYTSTSRSSSHEAITLFRLRGSALEPVFSGRTHEGNTDKPADEEAEPVMTDTKCTIGFDKRRRDGVFDLLHRCDDGKVTRYGWSKDRYAPVSAR